MVKNSKQGSGKDIKKARLKAKHEKELGHTQENQHEENAETLGQTQGWRRSYKDKLREAGIDTQWEEKQDTGVENQLGRKFDRMEEYTVA